jgi:hypothetical protein
MKAQSARKSQSARQALWFSCIGPAYTHLLTASCFVIVLSLESSRISPSPDLGMLCALGSLLLWHTAVGSLRAISTPACFLPNHRPAGFRRFAAQASTTRGFLDQQ